MLPQPDWESTPEFQLLNHRMMSRVMVEECIPNVSLYWGDRRFTKNIPTEEFIEQDPDDEAPPVLTRDDCVDKIQMALEESCLERMLEPATDADMACATYVLTLSTCSAPIPLPAATEATQRAAQSAGFNSFEHMIGALSQELRKLSKEAAPV